MENKRIRTIYFDLTGINNDNLLSVGVYKIINKINNNFYIGSSDRSFKERFKEHCRCYELFKEGNYRNIHPILWRAYNKYGINNFKVELIEILNNKTSQEILEREEYYIRTLNPEYNICKFPTVGGKPNLGIKLSEEWKQKIAKKSSVYKHSSETLSTVIKNNKNNAVKLKMINTINNEELFFNSWKDAGNYFNITPEALQKANKRIGIYKKVWKQKNYLHKRKRLKFLLITTK